MKPNYLAFGAVFIGLVVIGSFFLNQNRFPPTSSPVATATMVMSKEGYTPQDIEIKKGTKVIFKNESDEPRWPASDIHPTHGIYPEFDPKQPVEPGSEWSFVFDKVGRWKYHDHLFPLIRGVITVTE